MPRAQPLTRSASPPVPPAGRVRCVSRVAYQRVPADGVPKCSVQDGRDVGHRAGGESSRCSSSPARRLAYKRVQVRRLQLLEDPVADGAASDVQTDVAAVALEGARLDRVFDGGEATSAAETRPGSAASGRCTPWSLASTGSGSARPEPPSWWGSRDGGSACAWVPRSDPARRRLCRRRTSRSRSRPASRCHVGRSRQAIPGPRGRGPKQPRRRATFNHVKTAGGFGTALSSAITLVG